MCCGWRRRRLRLQPGRASYRLPLKSLHPCHREVERGTQEVKQDHMAVELLAINVNRAHNVMLVLHNYSHFSWGSRRTGS